MQNESCSFELRHADLHRLHADMMENVMISLSHQLASFQREVTVTATKQFLSLNDKYERRLEGLCAQLVDLHDTNSDLLNSRNTSHDSMQDLARQVDGVQRSRCNLDNTDNSASNALNDNICKEVSVKDCNPYQLFAESIDDSVQRSQAASTHVAPKIAPSTGMLGLKRVFLRSA